MIRIIPLIVLWLSASISLLAQAEETPAEVFSLEEAIEYAKKRSIEIKKAELDIAYADAQIKEFRSIGIPKVNAEVGYQNFPNIPVQVVPDFISPVVVGTMEEFGVVPPGSTENIPESPPIVAKFGTNNNFTASVEMSALLFDGSYFVGLKAAKGVKDLNQRQRALTEYDLRYAIINAYQRVLLIQENKKTLDSNIANLETTLKETQALYDNGFAEQLDVDRLTLTYSNLKSERDIVSRQEQLALNGLKFQMGYPMEEDLQLSDELSVLVADAENAISDGVLDISNRIELDIFRQNENLNELNKKNLQMQYYPRLVGFASHQQVLLRNDLFDGNEAGFNPTTVLGLTLSIPIFDGLEKKYKIEQVRIDQERLALDMRNFRRATSMQVQNARINYVNAKQRLENQRKNLQLAERILETTRIKYREGVGSSLEVNQAEQELYQTQANYINSLYDLLVAKTDLDKAQGI